LGQIAKNSGLVKKTTHQTFRKVTSQRHHWKVMTSHANFRDNSITAKGDNDITNRRARPFYKPLAHLTRRTALIFNCFYPVQHSHLRCRETRNDSITAKSS